MTAVPIAVAVALVAAVLLQFSSGANPAVASDQCPNTGSPFGPFDIDSYEAEDYRDVYARTFELAAFNQLFPEHETFATSILETGDRAAGSEQMMDPYIPPVILKSIGFLESGWAQASYSPVVQYGEIGPVLASHDCGYGVMQITSGMQNISGVPNLNQAMIGSHFGFNIARGAAILSGKWNLSPEVRPIVGARDPGLIEDWYYAIWGYNGFAYSNHPLNPAYQPTRVEYSCGAVGDGFGHDRTQYPYQELVLGCSQRPPLRAGQQLWGPQKVHLPDLADPAFAGPLKLENWNPCAYSLLCAAMDIPTPNANHEDPTALSVTRADVIGEPLIGLSRSAISAALPVNAAPSGFTFDVLNKGTGVLGFQVLSNVSWLKVKTPAGAALGNDLGGDDWTVNLTVNPAGLEPGQYTGKVTINSLYSAGAPRTVVVDLLVGGVLPTPAPLAAMWADGNCTASVDPIDALVTMRHDAGLETLTAECPGMGWTVQLVGASLRVWGDVDCSGEVNPIDALKILRFDAGLSASQEAGCPDMGAAILISTG
ncbi:MAG TPA: hypothetical protein VIT93_05510 [Dehalococcoidia bacterium]